MHAPIPRFAVRLLGFGPDDSAQLAGLLAHAPAAGPAYFCLSAHSLQAPDVVLVNGEAPPAGCLQARTGCVLAVGGPDDLPCARIARPLERQALHATLAALLPPQAPPRRSRAGGDAGCPRTGNAARASGRAVLLLDHGGVLRDHLAGLLAPRRVHIAWTDSAAALACWCAELPVALVLVNAAVAGSDPYPLCARLTARPGRARPTVVLLAGPAYPFDAERARDAGVGGLLVKPVADGQLLAVVERALAVPVTQ